MAIVKYDAKTGKKLAKGATTTDSLGNTFKQGDTYAPKITASGGSSLPPRNDNQANGGAGYNALSRMSAQGLSNPDSSFQGTSYSDSSNIPSIAKTNVVNNTDLQSVNPLLFPNQNPTEIPTVYPTTLAQQEDIAKEKQADNFQSYLDKLEAPPSSADAYRKAQRETGILNKQQAVNELSGKLNSIVAQGQANQLSLVGQGRGIPEAIIGGQQAQIGRETAIAALPVQAQLSAAQGDLESAEQNLNTLFKIYSDDATNKYNYKKSVNEAIYNFASAQDKAQLDKIQKLQDREYDKTQKDIDSKRQISIEAAKNGASASVLSAIANSTNFDEALVNAGNYLATAQTDIVKLDNGNTVVVDKRTGKVISTLGGSANSGSTSVQRTVAGTPVTGYQMVEGDDPYFIAQSYGISVDKLKQLNPGIKDWKTIQPGDTLNVPQNPQESFIQNLLATEGGKSLTDTSIQKLDKGLTVLAQLGVLQKNVEGVKTGPLVGAFKSANPWDTQGQTIKASLNAIVPNLARGIYGEVGVLTDNDIKTYSGTIPNLKSTEDVRNAVLYITLDMIGKSIKNTLSVNAAAGRDVSGFTDIYTEMESTKNSILGTIPGASVPKAFQSQSQDDFLSQFSIPTMNINNSDFFNQLP